METEKELQPKEIPQTPIPPAEKIKTSNLEDNLQFLQATSTVPADVPTNPLRKIRLYVSGATKRLYIYDSINKTWYYIALT